MYLCIYFHLQLAKHFYQTWLDSSDTEHRTRKTPTTNWLFDRQWLLAVCGKLFLATELFTRCLSCNTLSMFSHCKLLHLNKVFKTEISLFRHHYWEKKFKNTCSFGSATDFFWIGIIRGSVSVLFCTDILTVTT